MEVRKGTSIGKFLEYVKLQLSPEVSMSVLCLVSCVLCLCDYCLGLCLCDYCLGLCLCDCLMSHVSCYAALPPFLSHSSVSSPTL